MSWFLLFYGNLVLVIDINFCVDIFLYFCVFVSVFAEVLAVVDREVLFLPAGFAVVLAVLRRAEGLAAAALGLACAVDFRVLAFGRLAGEGGASVWSLSLSQVAILGANSSWYLELT